MLDHNQPNGPKKRPASKRSDNTEQQGSPRKTRGSQDDFSPLVGTKLFYRNAVPTWERLPSGAPADSPSPTRKAIEREFVVAFNEVWNRLPPFDHHRLLSYWSDPAGQSLGIDAVELLHPRPLIQIVDIGKWCPAYFAVAKLGYELNFPVALIADHADRLHHEIARTLAMVYRLATRAHWQLVVSMIEEPLAQWEEHHGVAAPESDQDALEHEYLKAFEKQASLQLRGWRIEEPPCVSV